MKCGVPQLDPSRLHGASAGTGFRHRHSRSVLLTPALVALAAITSLSIPGAALAANPPVALGTATSFSVLAGSTVTNTGPTTMFGDLGLAPGSSVTGAPVVLGATHVDDAVAIGAKSSLVTAYNDAAGRPTNGSAGTDLAGQTFTPGVRTASTSLLLSAGSVTLDAQGDPNAVFIFQIGSTLTTGSNTSVSLINGAQACNVFWQVGSSATLGTGTSFVGTVMAAETITANTAATIHGRLLASTAAVNLDTNTITTATCASSEGGGGGGTETGGGGTGSGGGGGTETGTPAEKLAKAEGGAAATTTTSLPGSLPTTGTPLPIGSRTTTTAAERAAKRRAAARRAAAHRAALRHAAARRHSHSQARPAMPGPHGGFTG